MAQYSQAAIAPYSQKFLKPKTSNSYSFLEECTYRINLRQLYTLESTCYNHQAMDYCPVLVRISQDLQDRFCGDTGIQYLLQVWNRENKKIYERPLISPVKCWNIFYNYLIYRPEKPDENHDHIYLVDLENENSMILIEDPAPQDPTFRYFAYSNEIFYMASSTQIKLISLKFDVEVGMDIKMKPKDSDMAEISSEHLRNMLIHGLFINNKGQNYIIVALETEDNQIDFNMLEVKSKPGNPQGEEFSFEFRQFREVVPRNVMNDPIKKLSVCFNDKNAGYAVGLRKSGNADFYFTMARVASYEQKQKQEVEVSQNEAAENVEEDEEGLISAEKEITIDYSQPITDVDSSYDETYIQFGAGNNTVVKAIDHALQARVSVEEADVLENYIFKNIFYQKVKNHCKLFSCFVFVKTFIFVSHGRYLSLFNVLKQKWIDHIQFDSEIALVFRSEDGEGGVDICVLQDNGKIDLLHPSKECYEDGTPGKFEIDDQYKFEIEGDFLQHDQDRDDNRFTFIMAKKDTGQIILYCFFQRQFFDLTKKFENLNQEKKFTFTEETNFVFLFAEADETRFIVQEEDAIIMFEIGMPPDEDDGKGNDDDDDDDDHKPKKPPKEPEIKEIWRVQGIAKIRNDMLEKAGDDDEKERAWFNRDLHSAFSIQDRNDKVKFKDIKKEDVFKRINEHYFFVDKYHIYKIDKKTKNINCFENQNCVGLFLSDNNYLYTLSHKRHERNIASGFRLYDIWNCITTGQDLSYQLTKVQVGCQPLIDFSIRNQRFIFQHSFDRIEVLPVLHRNSIYFMGMGERDTYLATKTIDDKFIALNNQNRLITWSILSGKVREEYDLNDNEDPNQDYSGFEVYRFNSSHMVFPREWYSKILLKSKEPVQEEIDDNLYFHPDDIKTSIKNQIPFAKKAPKKYHEFRLIEVMSESQVKEVASFIYPFWNGQRQYIYFSESGDLMFERLFYDRFQIYRKVSLNDPDRPSRCRWELVRRLSNLPPEFLKNTQHPFYMSPDFHSYLDIDQKNGVFIIRDTITQKVAHEIPKWLMNCNGEEKIADIVYRFKWQDNESIRVINNEGFERLIRLDASFSEISFHAIPLYMSYWCTFNHYYYDKPEMELDHILERLKRKYQAYKAATVMECTTDPKKLYRELLTVDYLQVDNDDKTKFERHIIDHSFTFLHWNLVEQLEKGTLQVSQINIEQLKCLIYNIFPGGDTVLHKLKDNGAALEKIYEQCHFYSDEEKRLKSRYHLPFVKNFEGLTPMDLLVKKLDMRNMDKMLFNLQPYGADHHSRELHHLINVFIENGLPSLNIYLKSRVIQTKFLKKIDKGIIQDTGVAEGMSVGSFWISDDELKSVIQSGEVEQEVRLEFIDIANLHNYTSDHTQPFFDALANCEDYELFEQIAIKKIIDFKWPLTREFTIKRLLVPYLIFMTTYLLYMNWIYMVRKEEGYFLANYVFIGILGFFCWYFIVLEMKQLKNEGLDYLKSPWNYLDLIPPITLIIFLPLEIFGYFDYTDAANLFIAEQRILNKIGETAVDPTVNIRTIEAILQSILSLIIWLKLLYFLRIFKATGYYIRTIVEVIKDMKYFLAMLLLTFVAFADSIRQISTSNEPENDFINGTFLTSVAFVYRMVLGDFDTNEFGEVAVSYVWILFILCTVFNMIIMMNLLIAIISESFANVTSVSEQASYREMADIIYENTYLIPDDRRAEYCAKDKYLIFATDKLQEIDGQMSFEDQVEAVVEAITDKTKQVQKSVFQEMTESQVEIDTLLNVKTREINKQRDKIYDLIQVIHKDKHG